MSCIWFLVATVRSWLSLINSFYYVPSAGPSSGSFLSCIQHQQDPAILAILVNTCKNLPSAQDHPQDPTCPAVGSFQQPQDPAYANHQLLLRTLCRTILRIRNVLHLAPYISRRILDILINSYLYIPSAGRSLGSEMSCIWLLISAVGSCIS